jgi:hypothetical protein
MVGGVITVWWVVVVGGAGESNKARARRELELASGESLMSLCREDFQ